MIYNITVIKSNLKVLWSEIMKYLKKIIEIRNIYKENQDLKCNFRKMEQEKDELEKDKDRAYKGCGVRDAEINFLKHRLDEANRLHEEVVERIYNNDNSRKEYTCINPFEYVDILRGEVYPCISDSLKHNFSLGNIYTQTFEEIWNSNNSQKIRYSVTKGNFEYCNHRCMWLNNKDKIIDVSSSSPLRLRNDTDYKYESYNDCICKTTPQRITLSLDETCNLTCPSCRSENRTLSKEDRKKLILALENVIRPMLKDCKRVSVSSSGEFFAMKEIQEFFKTLTVSEFPDLTIVILTNGQLLTREKWDEFKNLHDMPVKFFVSIDAAEKDTYEKLRRGGKWEILCENMNFVSELRKNNKIKGLQLNFVIQGENYNQIEKFVELGRKWNADEIVFQKITNLGTFTDEEFKKINIADKENLHYQELVNIMSRVLNSTKDMYINQSII